MYRPTILKATKIVKNNFNTFCIGESKNHCVLVFTKCIVKRKDKSRFKLFGVVHEDLNPEQAGLRLHIVWTRWTARNMNPLCAQTPNIMLGLQRIVQQHVICAEVGT